MRFKLSLQVHPGRNRLPMNYQYEISSWIYKTIHYSDSEFSQWLHNRGITVGNKRFKLFTFSQLFLHPPWKPAGDRLIIHSGRASLQLSFYLEEAVEHFIIGLFQQQQFRIGDTRSVAEFAVETIERLPDPQFTSQAAFRCISPLCISMSMGEDRPAEYLSPEHPDFQRYFFENLLTKYLAVHAPEKEVAEAWEEMNAHEPFTLATSPKTKSRLITIKTGTPQQTRVKGYLFDFKITAPPELIAFGYQVGFGEKNSLGFGCVECVG